MGVYLKCISSKFQRLLIDLEIKRNIKKYIIIE